MVFCQKLIVDDVIDNIRLISNILNRHNYSTQSAMLPMVMKALEIVDSFTPDLIMLDVVMPGMDGTSMPDFKENSLTADPGCDDYGAGQSARPLKGLEAGVDDFISKPFNVC
jgi:CheY-like chemotaxis protein